MLTVSTGALILGAIVLVVLGLAAWVVARGVGDKNVNRLQELLELLGKAPGEHSTTGVHRKSGIWHLDINGFPDEVHCIFDPRHNVIRYQDDGMSLVHQVRHGREQEDVNHFVASLNIHQEQQTAAEKLAELAEDQNHEITRISGFPASQQPTSPETEATEVGTAAAH